MSYADLLRDPRWQKKRLEILERDEWMCTECDDASTELHVHHTHYVKGRKPWEYDADDLRSLCKTCHARITERTAELHLRVGLMREGTFDIVLGLVRALSGYDSDDVTLAVENFEVALGVAAFYRISPNDIIDHVIHGEIRRDTLAWLRQATTVTTQ